MTKEHELVLTKLEVAKQAVEKLEAHRNMTAQAAQRIVKIKREFQKLLEDINKIRDRTK